MDRIGFHTQECRGTEKLEKPIICKKDNAWFGNAYYFWDSIDDADYWGKKFKTKTGRYDVYQSKIDLENFLDTVFNEKHYKIWINAIEKLALKFKIQYGKEFTLKELNDYFKSDGLYKSVHGVVFQDISNNEEHYLIKGMQYKKRIQFAVFNELTIKEFVHLHTTKLNYYDRYR